MLLITFKPSLPHAGAGLVETYEICFLPKSADRRGRSCAGPQTMFDIFF